MNFKTYTKPANHTAKPCTHCGRAFTPATPTHGAISPSNLCDDCYLAITVTLDAYDPTIETTEHSLHQLMTRGLCQTAIGWNH